MRLSSFWKIHSSKWSYNANSFPAAQWFLCLARCSVQTNVNQRKAKVLLWRWTLRRPLGSGGGASGVARRWDVPYGGISTRIYIPSLTVTNVWNGILMGKLFKCETKKLSPRALDAFINSHREKTICRIYFLVLALYFPLALSPQFLRGILGFTLSKQQIVGGIR